MLGINTIYHERNYTMRFQSGQSGNPAGRPLGALNKKTLAARAAMAERAEEIAHSVMDRAKDGQPAAMRLCMERIDPTGRNRPIAIDLPVVKTPEDAEAALAVVTAALAAGDLTIAEASALVSLVDRMLRLAERMWNFARSRRYGAARDAIIFDEEKAPEGTTQPPGTAETPRAPLYSPVNSGVAAGGEGRADPSGREDEVPPLGTPREEAAPPLPRAA
jgi:hypothetical protein